jgi:6-phosphogluconolactonase (cycloisomerase 2 family)
LDFDAETGILTLDKSITEGSGILFAGIEVSPDGRHLYLVGWGLGTSGINVYERDQISGDLSMVEVWRDTGPDAVPSLDGISDLLTYPG